MFAWCPYYTGQAPATGATRSNFDGEGSTGVREFVIDERRLLDREFHLDGLRLDATQAIRRFVRRARARRDVAPRARGRRRSRRSSSSARTSRRTRAPAIDCGLDALWNDDFHHSARVAVTGVDRRLSARLSRYAAGAGLRDQARVSVSRPALPVAEATRAARRRAAAAARSSCTSSRITIRSRTSASASGSRTSPIRARCARLTALLLLGARAADAVPGPGDRRRAGRGGSSSITARSSAIRSARVARSS